MKARSKGWAWALLQVGVLAAEILFVLFLLAQPGLRPRTVNVIGARHESPDAVTQALSLPSQRSIFLVDTAALSTRVRALPWVRGADVSLVLPDKVTVRITEWVPAAVLTVGERSYYLDQRGRVLGPADEAGPLPVIGRPLSGAVRPGDQVLDPSLLGLLPQIQQGFPQAYGLRVLNFNLDRDQIFTLRTDRGWTIIFGQMATADQFATLTPKLGALRALSTRINLTSAPISYINVMNPRAPAVQLRTR
jgi:cell division septal protein FtsQ